MIDFARNIYNFYYCENLQNWITGKIYTTLKAPNM